MTTEYDRGRAAGLAEAVKWHEDKAKALRTEMEESPNPFVAAVFIAVAFHHEQSAAAIRAISPDDGTVRVLEASPEDLRAKGMSVAIHNDYRLNGENYTFWLMVRRDGMSFKGEGKTDAEALNQIRAMIAKG